MEYAKSLSKKNNEYTKKPFCLITERFFMLNITLPFPAKIDKKELHSFYLSFLVRGLVIKWDSSYHTKITKKEIYNACKSVWMSKSTITTIWNKWAKIGQFFQEANNDFVVLVWKDTIVWEKWFCTKIDELKLWFYSFYAFVTEIYQLRPVTQTKDIMKEYKRAMSKKWKVREELLKRLDEVKLWRWQEKLSSQVWCTKKTISNRVKRNTGITVIKRYDTYNGFRVNLTNLYYKKWIVFLNYNTKKFMVSNNPHKSLGVKAIFLNNSLGLYRSNDTIYNLQWFQDKCIGII